MNKKEYTGVFCKVIKNQFPKMLASSPDVPYDPGTDTEEALSREYENDNKMEYNVWEQ